jgi:DNA-binding NtrC family response regulator
VRPRLELVVIDGGQVSVHPLPAEGAVCLGRSEECDVRIDNASVSRRHARVHVGAALAIEDLGSANGTVVPDAWRPADAEGTLPLRRLSKATLEIAVGARVNVGTSTVVVRRAEPDAAAPPEDDDAAVARDPAMRALYAQAARAAQGPISVLILGETGVGKEVLAREIHRRSPRARAPFLAINCASLSESLLESELFGHEKGAFTGAQQARPGLFEAAHEGTVFLDEIGELPMVVQVKLLRVLEDRTVIRVGGRAPQRVDVRFLSATHRDLEAEIARGAFRQDLYFRLNGVSLTIPPLRERRSEIAVLARRFAAVASAQLDQPRPPAFAPEALEVMDRYAWPGNVRELRNVVERAVVMCTGATILPEDLPPRLTSPTPVPAAAAPPAPATQPPPADPHASLQGELVALERRRIVEALEKCAGNQTHAAALLGMSRRTLVARLSEYAIPRPRKR